MAEDVRKERKMAFYELQKGRLAVEMQRAFERSQLVAMDENAEASVTLKIKISPSEDSEYGGISYEIRESIPTKKSIKLTTRLKGGIIVSDGESEIDTLQGELMFAGQPSIHKLVTEGDG